MVVLQTQQTEHMLIFVDNNMQGLNETLLRQASAPIQTELPAKWTLITLSKVKAAHGQGQFYACLRKNNLSNFPGEIMFIF